ncbi:MAG: hypothetical protein K0M45_12135 [Candidatus Paracaedibacteraceae bacterium]|nr:hypothetical protein [Candidatus Paracaedibacteraceae bacterium]
MRKIQIKISASRLSQAVLVAASLSCFGFSGSVSAAETPTLAATIHENLRQQALSQSDLEYKQIQITTFKKNDSSTLVINERSKHNIGHQQNSLKAYLKKRDERFSKINTAQVAARTLSTDFIPLLAELSYISFNHVFSFAKKGAISIDSLMCAEETWLLKALVDYGIVSHAYISLLPAKAAAHDAIILKETGVLKDSLIKEKKAKEDAQSREREILVADREKLEREKQLSLKDKEEAQGEDLKRSHQKVIDKKDAELKAISLKEEKLEADTKAALKVLDKKFEADIKNLENAKKADLEKLQAGYASLFSEFGFKWGGSWTRGRREDIKEILYFDELLSTEYTDFYSKSQSTMLETLFSLIQDEDAELKYLTLKAVLELDDSIYNRVLQNIVEQKKQTQKELGEVVDTFTENLSKAIQEVDSPPIPQIGAVEKPTPTAEQSKVAQSIAQGFDPSKKKSDESTVNNSGDGEHEEASVLPLSEVSLPPVSSADKKASEEETNVSASLVLGKIPSTLSYVIPSEGSLSRGNNRIFFPQLNTVYPSFSDVVKRNGRRPSAPCYSPDEYRLPTSTDSSYPDRSILNMPYHQLFAAETTFSGSANNTGASLESGKEQKKNKRRYYHPKRTHRVYSGKPNE